MTVLAALGAFLGVVISIGFAWVCTLRWWDWRTEVMDAEAERLWREKSELAHKQRLAELRRALAEAEGVLTTVDVEGFFDALFDDITRLKAAERDLSSLISGSDRTRDTELALVKRERDRADAAEKKLRTLVEAVERTVPWSTNAALAAALKAAR